MRRRERSWLDVPHDAEHDISAAISGLMANLEILTLDAKPSGIITKRHDGEADFCEWQESVLYFPRLSHRRHSTLMLQRTESTPLTATPSRSVNYTLHDILLDHDASLQDAQLATTSIYTYKKSNRGVSRDFSISTSLELDSYGREVSLKIGEFKSSGIVMSGPRETGRAYADEGWYGELDAEDELRVRNAVSQMLWPMVQFSS